MVLMVGLGNPGSRYVETRHNVGFMVVEELAARHRTTFRPGRGPWLETAIELAGSPRSGSATERGEQIVLLKPTTYMNASGAAVVEAVGLRQNENQRLLVVFDDFQLPLGRIRLRERGTDGGHNGLASVLESLGTLEVPRLRCGIASEHMPADKERLVEFVLEPFEPDEAEVVRSMVVRAADACETAVRRGWAAAMNEFNRSLTDDVDGEVLNE